MKLSSKRAGVLATLALAVQMAFFLLVLLVGFRSGSIAIKIEAWHFLGGVGIWLILLLQFRQRRFAEDEQLDVEQYHRLRKEGKDKSVFEGVVTEEQMHIAERRLAWLEKYLLPIFAILISGYLIGMGGFLFRQVRLLPGESLIAEAVKFETAVFLAGFALVSFLFSRYAAGMGRQAEWRPLRAGGSYLLSNALACFVLAIIVLLPKAYAATAGITAGYVLSILMVLIGVEIILNLVLDAYRPRVKGQYRRAAFESRLLGLFSEPGGILRTAGHALDYQFGFKVSETWFYKLLEKAVLPLLILQGVVLYLLSCLVIVQPGSVAVQERWGRPLNMEVPWQSGLHLKMPWPIDKVRSFPVEQLQWLEIGFERNDPKFDAVGHEIADMTPILWSVDHWKQEYPFILAVSDSSGNKVKSEAVGGEVVAPGTETQKVFDLLVAAFGVYYRISDISQYGYGYYNPDELLESICYQEAIHYCGRSTIEQLLGPGRGDTAQALEQAIQERVKECKLGVKIERVMLESVHPPVKVAESFENVISALQDKQASVLKSQGVAESILASARAESSVIQDAAKAYAVERVSGSAADSERYKHQLSAYEKGKGVYLLREYLSVLDEVMPDIRKYVIGSDKVNRWVYEFDLKEKLQPDLFSGLGLPEDGKESGKK